MRKKRFITNVFIMSASMLIIRIVGMASNIYISARAGATSMGIYHMIFSVLTFGITFAASGTGFAVTRLASEGKYSDGSIIRKCLIISGAMSTVGFCFFFFASSFVGKSLIKNPDTVSAVRMLSFALPCMGASSVYRGYFIAKRRAGIMTASSIAEEAICIAVTIMLLSSKALSKSYMCLVYGCLISNFAAFVFDTAACRICLRKELCRTKGVVFKDIFAICIPIALGSYLRTGLVAAENLMIPLQFEKFGVANAVGEYGIIKAMAMPILMFPTVFIQAFSSMLVPEISEMNAHSRPNGIRHVTTLAINTATMFSFFIAMMLLKHHDIISSSFFKEPEVSHYLGMLSLLAIPMYLDTVADSILKGLNLQNASLVYNITDSALRLASIILIMPRIGPVFYIAMLYISEIFNLTLSLGKVAKTSNLKIDFVPLIVIPAISACAASLFESPPVQAAVYASVYLGMSKLLRRS